jgi:hypothetical protein
MEQPIEASTTSRVPFARACEVLLDDPGAVFSESQTDRQRSATRFRTELSVDLGAGASVHQKVTLHEGVPRPTVTGLVLPVTWQATGRDRLLPTFSGALQVSERSRETGLRLDGTYTVPLGAVGRFGNGVVGRRLARRSLNTLVELLASRLESEVARRDSLGGPRESPALVFDVQDHPEIYIG